LLELGADPDAIDNKGLGFIQIIRNKHNHREISRKAFHLALLNGYDVNLLEINDLNQITRVFIKNTMVMQSVAMLNVVGKVLNKAREKNKHRPLKVKKAQSMMRVLYLEVASS
jgi:hypothetical protein